MEVRLIRTPVGFVVHPEDADLIKRIKIGVECVADVRQPRNLQFHRKYLALLRIAFDVWCETDRTANYKGTPVLPNFERFRRDVAVLSGFYEMVVTLKGDVRFEPKSISFGKMDNTEFEKLYSSTIDVVLQKIIPKGRYTEDQLRKLVDTIVGFA